MHTRNRGRVKQHRLSQTPQAQAQNRQTRLLESDFPADTPAEDKGDGGIEAQVKRKVQRPEGTERLQDGSSSKTDSLLQTA